MDLAANNEPLVSVKNISFSFGSTKVLEDINLSITQGDFLAVIGPNGSGKSTLVKIILRIYEPGNGSIVLLGEDLKNFEQWDKIGYVPQKATNIDPFFPVSVREVVGMGLLSKKSFPRFLLRRDEKIIDQALEQVDLKDFKSRRIGELSGGQQQRVFIARAIVNQPSLLFLDEPTTGVDAETQERFYSMLGTLNQAHQITIVLITHDLGILNKHVNKIACLNQRLVFHGMHDDFCNSELVQELLRGEHHLVCHRH
ncbi:MAG: metal ABC transporter ATP-binding protein [Thermodesulfobacteriota bacterium]|jgi:zinc transport system ATP-binding protein|nr:MAG: metal ABC transporter ATP-binding protein [Thermodesulfobacteriota bacterium]